MVGRDAELSALTAAAARARQGEVGLVLVTGEAGIGKSRLVSEFVGGVDDALALVSHGVAMSTGEIPFGVLADLLKNLLGADPTLLTDHERDALAPLLPGTTRSGDRITMLSTALDLLERLSSDRLVLWVVDDLHWADAASRDLLAVALHTSPGHRLLVVATVRTDDPARSSEQELAVNREMAKLAQLPVAETLHLGRLGLADVRRQLAGMDVSADAIARAGIEKLSGGIPFVVEELAASGGTPQRATHLTVSRTRLAALPPDALRLVEAAAIGDGHLRLSLLEQVTDMAGDELDLAIKAATMAGVLEEQPSHEELAFRHPLLREAVDESIAPGARRGWHRRWAEVLQANPGVLAAAPATIAVAQHWAGSGDTGKALHAAARAAVAAGELDLHEVEADMWDRVLELWDGVTALPGLERYNEREIRRFRRWAVGQVDNERFLQLLDEDLRRAEDPSTRACLELSVTTQNSAALGGSAGPGDRAGLEQRARSGPRDIVLAVFLSNLGEALLQEGEVIAARALLDESVTILRERGDIGSAVRMIAGLALMQAADGTAEEAITELEKLLEDPALDRPYVRRWVGYALVLLHQLVGDARAADAAFDMVASTLDTRLDWPTYERQLNVIMRSWLDAGRWQHARNTYEALRPNWAGHVVMSDLHAARLDLMAPRQGVRSGLLAATAGPGTRSQRRRPGVGLADRGPGIRCRGRSRPDARAARHPVGADSPPVQRPRPARAHVDGRARFHPDRGGRGGAPPRRPGPGGRRGTPGHHRRLREPNASQRRARPRPGRPNSRPSSPDSAATPPSSSCSRRRPNDGRPSDTTTTRRCADFISRRRTPVAANARTPAPKPKRHSPPRRCWAPIRWNNKPSRCCNGSVRPSAPTACSPDVNAKSWP